MAITKELFLAVIHAMRVRREQWRIEILWKKLVQSAIHHLIPRTIPGLDSSSDSEDNPWAGLR